MRKLLKLELVEPVPSKKGTTKSGTYKRTKKKVEDVVTKAKETKAKEAKETKRAKAA
jgi:pyrroline-5-carboxylate reductase